MKNMTISRGDIFYITNIDEYTVGSEQSGSRPGIIVSNNKANTYSPVVEVVYLTSVRKKKLPTHVLIHGVKFSSIALCEQIHSVSVSRLGRRIGTLTEEEMNKVNQALKVSLELE